MKQLFIAFMAGILFCLIIVESCNGIHKQVNVKELKKEVKISGNLATTINQNFQKEKQAFTLVADSLKTENQKLNVKLQVARTLFKKQQRVVVSNIPCDTLRKEVVLLNELSNVQDSLYSVSINARDQAAAVRDSQIVICNNSYDSMFDLQKENQKRQEQLTEDLNTAHKHNRKERVKNKMLSFGLMVMTGITTTLFIKSQK